MSKKRNDLALLDGYEKDLVTGNMSLLSQSVSKTQFADALQDVLASRVVVNGREMDLAHLLSVKRIAYLLQNPDRIDLAEISKANLEQKNSSVDVSVTIKPSSIFERVDEYQGSKVIEAKSSEAKKA